MFGINSFDCKPFISNIVTKRSRIRSADVGYNSKNNRIKKEMK
jgi:hypothetical protein